MSKYHIEKIDLNSESSHAKLLRLVGMGRKVLEFGCASGYVSKVLKEQLACSVTGIEIDSDAAKEAGRYCSKVLIGNIEEMDISGLIGDEKFDVFMFGDVLEHLRYPEKVLARARPLLPEGGYVLASIPNIAHISVALDLLEGKFEYRPLGLLDNTHIRFFTKKTIYSLFRDSGYEIIYWDRVIVKPEETEFKTVLQKYPLSLLSFFEAESEAQTYQFVVKAVPFEPKEGELLQKEAEKTAFEELRGIITEQELLIRESISLKNEITSLKNSWSWRITDPLRKIMGLLKK